MKKINNKNKTIKKKKIHFYGIERLQKRFNDKQKMTAEQPLRTHYDPLFSHRDAGISEVQHH
jgi:hypothetical protein